MKKGVLLLSGGLDSSTVLAWMKKEGYAVYALSFNYGQRHDYEMRCVQRIVERQRVTDHKVIQLDLRAFGGSALTADIEVPKNAQFNSASLEIPVTYVPARNTLFLSYALAYAEVNGIFDIFFGANSIDYSNYPDCRPEFVESFEEMANLATAATVRGGSRRFKIHAPLLRLNKAEIVKLGISLDVDYSLTHSCYDPAEDGVSCGLCDACHLRIKGFQENGMSDPIVYRSSL